MMLENLIQTLFKKLKIVLEDRKEMPLKYHNIFINSKNRQENESVSNFIVNFQTAGIVANESEYISINVISFDMMNAMYNVNSITGNNTFILTIDNTDYYKTIPYGNYDVFSFRDVLKTLLSGVINVEYNTAQNTYTFTKIINNNSNYFISPLKAYKLFGFTGKTQIISYTGGFINMVNYNKIILRAGNINFEYFTYENIRQPEGLFVENSDIIFWISKQDVEPFKMISYNNEDASKSFHYNIYNKELDSVELKLTNENNEEIIDAPDFLLGLQIIIHDRNQDILTNTSIKILDVLSEIKMIILQGLRFIGFFSSVKNRR